MIRSTRLVLLVLAALSAVSVLPARPRVDATAASMGGATDPEPTAGIALPPGFASAVDVATSSRFVRVVADDIDRDGDLDVVATVGTHDLLVWENDGAGHFSRRRSSAHEEMRADPPGPTLDGDDVESYRWLHHHQDRGARPSTTGTRADDGPESPLTALARASTNQYGPRRRSSRAPPVA
jgi:hypothetical protein